MYTLDSNAIIYFVKEEPQATDVLIPLFNGKFPLFISAITETELFGFPNLSLREAGLIEEVLQTLSIVPVDSKIARRAGQLRRLFRTKTVDSVIAATAMLTGSVLLTRNTKDFRQIPNLSVQKI
jgi:predicted nucleic acid-binding protein